MALIEKLTAIANAVRAKTGKTEPLTLEQMVTEIDSIGSVKDSRFVQLVERTLEELTVDNLEGVRSIGNYAFYRNEGITSAVIPDSVTNIGTYAFARCTGLTSITIPDGVTSIGSSAFSECSALTYVNCLGDIGRWAAIDFGDYMATPTHRTKTLHVNGKLVTQCVIPDDVTHIGSYAFYQLSQLTDITIGKSVTSIGRCAFQYCTGLTSITIPDNVTTLNSSIFDACSNLTDVVIGDGVTTIPNSLFYSCRKLENITIGRGVTEIAVRPFSSVYKAITLTMLPTTPPTLSGSLGDITTNGTVIYVPVGCAEAYKAATNWSTYADLIQEMVE